VRQGQVSVDRINQSVRRILRLKFELGLVRASLRRRQQGRRGGGGRPGDATLKAAQQSITCCATRTTCCRCPAGAKLVVTGPSADSMTNQLGGWSVSWQGVFRRRARLLHGTGRPDTAGHHRVLSGLRAATPNVTYAPTRPAAVPRRRLGRGRGGGRREGLRRGAGRQPGTSAAAGPEGAVSALRATGKPVIVVVIAGRPLGLGPAREAAGLLMAYQGSTEAGTAVAT
jgi:beta-glucosidase